uniref:Uncharacterized protein n=1 Tax=Caenorhabditis tropicalis TaxID=1561998 RepID=A0A1I7TTU7_9PELO
MPPITAGPSRISRSSSSLVWSEGTQIGTVCESQQHNQSDGRKNSFQEVRVGRIRETTRGGNHLIAPLPLFSESDRIPLVSTETTRSDNRIGLVITGRGDDVRTLLAAREQECEEIVNDREKMQMAMSSMIIFTSFLMIWDLEDEEDVLEKTI